MTLHKILIAASAALLAAPAAYAQSRNYIQPNFNITVEPREERSRGTSIYTDQGSAIGIDSLAGSQKAQATTKPATISKTPTITPLRTSRPVNVARALAPRMR